MLIIKFIVKFWEFVSRLARVIAIVDDAIIEAKAFYDWLTGKPEKPDDEK